MPSATEAVNAKKGTTVPLLKGEDLWKAKLHEVKIVFSEVRDPGAQFNSPLIADLKNPILEKGAFPINKTNAKILTEALGDDYSKWAGAKVTLERVLTNNPQTKKQAIGLIVTEAKKA